jgi:hypothetical protein
MDTVPGGRAAVPLEVAMIARHIAVLACLGMLTFSLGSTSNADDEKTTAAEPATSKSIAYGTYGAEQGRVAVVVSAYLASFEKSEKHFALQVAVGVGGKGPEYTFKRESFWLVDAKGISHEMSAPEELGKEVSLIEFTEQTAGRFPLQLPKTFEFYNQESSDFYSTENLRWNDVHLSQDTFFEDVLFFVHPAGGLDGVLTLQVAGEGTEDAVEVKFEVPPDKKTYKSEHKKNTKKKKKEKGGGAS